MAFTRAQLVPYSISNNNNNKNNHKHINRAIIVSNLKPDTTYQEIRTTFRKFGRIYDVARKKNKSGQFNGTATVEFEKPPRNFDIDQLLTINGQVVRMDYGRILLEEQRPTYCDAKSVTLGMMLTPTEFVEEWTACQNVKLQIFYARGNMNVKFRHLGVPYLVEIKFGDIENDCVMVENIGSATYLTIQLNQPPKLFKHYTVPNKPWLDKRTRSNTIPLTQADSTINNTCNSPTLIHTIDNNVRIETWTVYRIKFDPKQNQKYWLGRVLNRMADYNLVPRDAHLNKLQQLKITPGNRLPIPKNHQQRAQLVDFDVLYNLECNISANYLMERNLDDKFYDLLALLDTATACGILEVMVQNKKRIWNPVEAMENIIKEHGKQALHKRQTSLHCSLVRKVIISPTATYFQPLSLETANRIVRKYKQYADRFMRVQFADENFSKLGPAFGSASNSNLYARVYHTLQYGLQIGNRRYDYLGYSSSQLREQGCWFYAASDGESELPQLDVDSIRSSMGDFSDIKNVAKHAARIAQCFSSTKAIIELEKEQVKVIDDIKVNQYTFSDGVGNISRDLADEVAKRMSLRVIPSAFQFRLGGAKGILMVSDRLEGQKVELRQSQIKFQSDHPMLEIVRTSFYRPAFLNRQVITLLSSLGVRRKVFMQKLGSVLHRLNVMVKNPKTAIKVLQNYPDSFGVATFMTRIINAGFLERQDPFIKNLLNIFRLRTLKNLKEKAKLPVDKGAFVFGVVDETGVLKENEVFCHVTNGPGRKQDYVIQGPCIVYRNPCLHPGDIRVVNAVKRRELRDQLTNVIVFPCVGKRDIPSMCSGGDLDGDEYTIIWDKSLMPKIVNYTPMNYTPTTPKTKSEVTINDIKEFFVDYIKNDNLGQIANAHLATADKSIDGAMDPKCIRLAQLHSLAVDFPKTGNPAQMEYGLKVDQFPDFMCKDDKPTYVSKKVLGQMFERINKMDYDKYEPTLVNNQIYDPRLRVNGMEQYIASARQSLEKYNLDLIALMNQYGVNTEEEIISGFVMTWANGCNKKSDYESQQQTAAAAAAMRHRWKNEFNREFEKEISKKEIKLKKEAKAAAWYYVTYHPKERGRDIGTDSYFSFAWVMEDILVRLGNRFINRVATDQLMEAVDENLIKIYETSDSPDDTQTSGNNDDDMDDDFSNDDDDDDNDSSDDGDDGAGGDPTRKPVKDLMAHISEQQQERLAEAGAKSHGIGGPPTLIKTQDISAGIDIISELEISKPK